MGPSIQISPHSNTWVFLPCLYLRGCQLINSISRIKEEVFIQSWCRRMSDIVNLFHGLAVWWTVSSREIIEFSIRLLPRSEMMMVLEPCPGAWRRWRARSVCAGAGAWNGFVFMFFSCAWQELEAIVLRGNNWWSIVRIESLGILIFLWLSVEIFWCNDVLLGSF